jgi:hypothetical protein
LKKSPDKKMCILALALILVFGIVNDYAHGSEVGIILIGTVISPDEKGNDKTYELRTGEDMWRFTVTKVTPMTGAPATGWRILREINPRKIMLFGGEGVIAPLKQPDVAGKKFDLRGRLNLRLQTFHLRLVEEVMEQKINEVK